ncbi:MAG: 2-hydroxyacyl-CoA dehydratase [Candidatus Lokiarchaeota archaeon]|nr:2-hydroxyacyl-CoA dehydratase [Candidatus Lokiarchaeota archaeon]
MTKIGYFDADVVSPEEIFMAAGFTPIRLLGDPTIEYDKVNEHVPPTHCVWAKNILEQAIRGLNSEIKGVVTSHGCDCTNREFDIWIETVDIDFLFYLNVPLKRDKIALKFFLDDLRELISQIEDGFKIKIQSEKIKESIKLTNQIRRLLKEISEYRSRMILKGSEFHELVKLSQTNDKNYVLDILKKKLKELKNKAPFTEKKMKRILLTGSIIDDTEFLIFLEDKGFQVVADDLCIGSRYFWNTIEEDKDPIVAIAEYHLSKPLYSTKMPSYERFEFLKDLAGNYEVDGIINIAMKFCEPMLYDHPYMNKKFKELEIPYLFIEMSYNREQYKQLSTRFEAFEEII